MHIRARGFTIVELLIVIVVIAILAAVTIVLYNDIRTKAENEKTTEGVSKYVTALHSYVALNGNYPVEVNYPCLGPMVGGVTCARTSGSSSTCTASGGDGGAATQNSFDTNIKQIFSFSLPQVSSQQLSCGGNTYAGAYYRPSTGNTAVIVYYLKGDQACSGIAGVLSYTKTQQEDITRCVATLPPIP